MNHTAIEWVVNPDGSRPGWSWNPLTGCLNGCEYCYARKLANGRLRERYLNGKSSIHIEGLKSKPVEEALNDPFYPRFWEERLYEPVNKIRRWGRQSKVVHRQEPKGIFVCDMSDLFGIGIPEEWTRKVLDRFQYCPQHRFYLLTKQPQNLPKWSPFPDNCYVGMTLTKPDPLALLSLDEIEARIRYISVEPMLARFPEISFDEIPCDWLIIGACTGTRLEMEALIQRYPELTLMPYGNKWTAQPKIEWVEEIVRATDQAGIPVFLKDNLAPIIPPREPLRKFHSYHPECRIEIAEQAGAWKLRQEVPG